MKEESLTNMSQIRLERESFLDKVEDSTPCAKSHCEEEGLHHPGWPPLGCEAGLFHLYTISTIDKAVQVTRT